MTPYQVVYKLNTFVIIYYILVNCFKIFIFLLFKLNLLTKKIKTPKPL